MSTVQVKFIGDNAHAHDRFEDVLTKWTVEDNVKEVPYEQWAQRLSRHPKVWRIVPNSRKEEQHITDYINKVIDERFEGLSERIAALETAAKKPTTTRKKVNG